MKHQYNQTQIAVALATILATTALPITASAGVGLADGTYNMVINNTPYITGSGYDFGSDGAWNSSFTMGCLSGSKGCSSAPMYDDTAIQSANGHYAGVINDGVSGTIGVKVENGVITGLGSFEFDTVPAGIFGSSFVEYNSAASWTGSIDALGNITLTPTDTLLALVDFSVVDARWNVDDFNGGTGSGTNFVVNPPNNNTAYDSFSTGTATNSTGTINGAAYDGTRAILVKGGTMGSGLGGFYGASYFEVWNVSFVSPGDCTGDGVVDVGDLVCLQKSILSKPSP